MTNKELRKILKQFDNDAKVIWKTNWNKDADTNEVLITRCWYDPKEKVIMLGNPTVDEIKEL
jgi:hypothetical protein